MAGGDNLTMTKADLISIIAEKAKLDNKKAEMSVNLIFDSIIDALKRDERVEVRNFGSFQNRRYKGYTGRNPKTGQTVSVHAKIVPFFKVGKNLKTIVGSRQLQ